MKKLTKTLSLVLVVAMVLSLCVIGAGATFTDNDKITKDYSEAVTIATDLGIVSGVGNNTFAPAGTFTRAQAAVILTRLTLGATADKYVPSKVTFKDVPTSFWGYKFVEYAAQSGYVAGVGNGNYNPNATLTGYQWAAMLMKVLNITVPSTGSDWQINTAKAYYGADTKFSDVAISAANITREAATQMAYDALFAGTSKTTGYPVYLRTYNAEGTAYTDALVKTYPSITDAAAATTALNNGAGYTANDEAGANVKYYYYGTETTSTTTGTLAYTVFGVTKGTGVDTFGRPSTTYMTKTAKLATTYGWNASAYTTAAKTFANVAVATYTTPVTFGTLYTTLGSAATFDKANSYTNGVKNTVIATGDAVAVAKNNTSSVAGGFGIATEIYKVDTNKYVTVQVRYTFGDVAVSSAAANKTRGAYTSYTVTGSNVGFKLFSTVVDAENDVSMASVTGTVANGSKALYAIIDADHDGVANDAGDFLYVQAPATMSGVVSAKTANTGALTIDGKTYYMSSSANAAAPELSTTAQTLYVDSYGYVLAAKDTTTNVYALVISTDYADKLVNSKVVKVYNSTIAYADGTVATVDTYDGLTSSAKSFDDASFKGKMVKVQQGVNGYVLTEAPSTAYSAIDAITAKTATLTVETTTPAQTQLYANANTLFVYVGWDNTKSPAVATGKVTTVTGINNAKTLSALANTYALDTDSTKDGIANVVFVWDNKDATTDTYVYVKDVNYTQSAAGYTYNVIIGGKDTTLTVAQAGQLEANTLYSSITSSGATTTAVKATTTNDKVVNNGGLLFVDGVYAGKACASDVPVYKIDMYDDSVVASTFADLTVAANATDGVYIVTNEAGTSVLAIYVVYTSAT